MKGWEDNIGGLNIPERAGFSFSMLEEEKRGNENEILQEKLDENETESHSALQPPSKRARQ